MNRIHKILWAGCVVLGVFTPAMADEIPACRLGGELRDALGFGPQVLAALAVDETTHINIAGAAETWCGQNRETVEPLLTAVRTAKKNAFRQYELGGQTATTDQALIDAIASLASSCSTVISTMDNHLSVEQRALRGHTGDNCLLDSPLCLLELTEQQRTDLRSAQRTRDLVIKHHKNRKDLAAVKDAHADFVTAMTATLTQAQQTQHQTRVSAQRQHLGGVMAREETFCED